MQGWKRGGRRGGLKCCSSALDDKADEWLNLLHTDEADEWLSLLLTNEEISSDGGVDE
jgi:hypothetical protein